MHYAARMERCTASSVLVYYTKHISCSHTEKSKTVVDVISFHLILNATCRAERAGDQK